MFNSSEIYVMAILIFYAHRLDFQALISLAQLWTLLVHFCSGIRGLFRQLQHWSSLLCDRSIHQCGRLLERIVSKWNARYASVRCVSLDLLLGRHLPESMVGQRALQCMQLSYYMHMAMKLLIVKDIHLAKHLKQRSPVSVKPTPPAPYVQTKTGDMQV